ncbi:MAG: hypothetical protein PHQ27_00015 [Victivallales bacterium]|nr:hypothetical protein [Victivallales bacterium]
MHGLLWFYVVVYGVLLLGNAYFWLRHHGQPGILLYELLSGTYLLFMVLLFIYPSWQQGAVMLWLTMAVPMVLGAECYLAIFGDLEKHLKTVSDHRMTGAELETARGISVLFSAPAYIIAAKVFIDRFF